MKTYIVKLQCYRDETFYSSCTEYVTAESSTEARERAKDIYLSRGYVKVLVVDVTERGW